MGKQNHEYIPVKFSQNPDEMGFSPMSILLSGIFIFLIAQAFRKGQGGASTGKKMGKTDDKKKGLFGGGGGMNDLFGMSQSNAKQFGGEDG